MNHKPRSCSDYCPQVTVLLSTWWSMGVQTGAVGAFDPALVRKITVLLMDGGYWVCRPGLWEQLTQQNDFVVACACASGLFLMLGSMSLQWGMALTGMAICLPFQIAVSLSVGEPSIFLLYNMAPCPPMWHRLHLCTRNLLISRRLQSRVVHSMQGLASTGSWTIGWGRRHGCSRGSCASRWPRYSARLRTWSA